MQVITRVIGNESFVWKLKVKLSDYIFSTTLQLSMCLLFYMQYKLWTSELADSILHTVRSIIKFMCVSKTGSITLECYYWYTLPKILWVSHSVNWSSCSRCLIEASTKFRERRISQSKPSLNIGSVNKAFLFWYWQRPKKHFFRNIFF